MPGRRAWKSILEDTEKRVFELVQKRNTGELRTDPSGRYECHGQDRAGLQESAEMSPVLQRASWIWTYRTAGMQPSDLILVAARPSMGKTAFVLNIAEHMAFKAELYRCHIQSGNE